MITNRANDAIYDLRWQVRRLQLVSKWNDYDIEEALDLCEQYYQGRETNVRSRLWRLINCMNAVVMGWNGSKAVRQVTRERLLAKRAFYQRVYKIEAALDRPFEYEDDPAVLNDAEIRLVYASLRKRWNAAPQVWNRPMLLKTALRLQDDMRRRSMKPLPLSKMEVSDEATIQSESGGVPQ